MHAYKAVSVWLREDGRPLIVARHVHGTRCTLCGRRTPIIRFTVGGTNRTGHDPRTCPDGGLWHYHSIADVPTARLWALGGECVGDCLPSPDSPSPVFRSTGFKARHLMALCSECGGYATGEFARPRAFGDLVPLCLNCARQFRAHIGAVYRYEGGRYTVW